MLFIYTIRTLFTFLKNAIHLRDILFIYIFEYYLFMKVHFKTCDIWILFIHEKYHI